MGRIGENLCTIFAKLAKKMSIFEDNYEFVSMKGLKLFLKVLLAVAVLLLLAVVLVWQGEIRTLRTLTQVDGNPYLFTMEYKAAYDLDDVVEKDVDTNAELLGYVISRVGKGLPIKIKKEDWNISTKCMKQYKDLRM